jgi:hypothetical protein
MTALVSALDNFTPSQLGENGHSEYTWSSGTREQIIQLSFQLTRALSPKIVESLAVRVDSILSKLKTEYNNGLIAKEVYVEYMSIMFRLIGQTRDIIDGKGEYTLAYMQLSVWLLHFPELAKFALKCFVLSEDLDAASASASVHPYGSWKDIKHLHKYLETNCQKSGQNNNSELIGYAMQLLNDQLRQDSVSETPSLAAKWTPREKSAHSTLFCCLAKDYYSEYLRTALSEPTIKKAILKAKMDYRKLITSLNRKLDTVQIKQCANTWSEIVPTNQTSITLHKQKKAFLNLTKTGAQRSLLDDRIACAATFVEFAAKAAKGEVEVKGKRVGLNDFTKEALNLIGTQQQHSSEAQLLNAQWLNNSLETGSLGKMIAMVDVSGSMSGEPMNAAIALGLRIAEKSMLGKRVLTFSEVPTWVNLDKTDNFISSVSVLRVASWGMSTNFVSALNLILDAIVQQKLPAEDVEDMVLTILSDMQIDQADYNYASLMDLIEQKYAQAGIRVCGKPYKPPHILFWNLSSGTGFPTLSTRKNTSMMSGFSPALLNLFCEQGLNALQSASPWSLLIKSLENPRYSALDAKVREVL